MNNINVMDYSGLVVKIAKEYPGDAEDKIQAGWLGLLQAAEKYEPDKGFKFTTYAVPWIRKEIQMLVAASNPLYIPRYISFKRKEIVEKATQGTSIESLSEEFGVSEDVVKAIVNTSNGKVCLDKVDDLTGAPICEVISDNGPTLEESYIENEAREIIAHELRNIPASVGSKILSAYEDYTSKKISLDTYEKRWNNLVKDIRKDVVGGEMFSLHTSGKTMEEISCVYGVSKQAVSLKLKRVKAIMAMNPNLIRLRAG